tara:strand:+ start:544 stop:936 length:393 start_codon:yes stop_codon:yes gene_type:complete
MKAKNILVLLLVVAINTVGFAQKGKEKDPEKMAQMVTEKMTKKLELTEDQQKAVYEANLKMLKEKQEIQKQMKANREAHKAELSKVLSEEQMAKLEKKMEGRKEGRERKFRKRRIRKAEKEIYKTEVEDQ